MKDTNRKMIGKSIGGAIVVGLVGTISSTFLLVKNYSNEELKSQKSTFQVLKDASNFEADLDVAYSLSDGIFNKTFHKLKIEKNEPVIVTYQDYMSNEQVTIIQEVVDHYNDIFKSIDKGYSFKLVNKNEVYCDLNTPRIDIFNKDNMSDNKYGYADLPFVLEKDSDFYHIGAKIVLNSKLFNDEEYKDKAKYTILHEFSHCVGLGDVYVDDFGRYEGTTIMNNNNLNAPCMLYPNDYAILQAMYSNEYLRHDNYEDAVKVVKEKIDLYEEKFYQNYTNLIKDLTDNFIDLSEGESINISGFMSPSTSYDFCQMQVSNNKFYFKVIGNKGEIKEESCVDVEVYNGVMFVKSLNLNNIDNYFYKGMNPVKGNIMLAIYRQKDEIVILENSGVSTTSGYFKESKVDKSR